VAAWALTSVVQAHEVARVSTPSAVLGLGTAPAPVAARYAVTIDRVSVDKGRAKPERHTWYFYRDAQRVALLKGSVDELWFRDAQQRISFERVFHDDQRVVDYSTGELATLGVSVDWTALSTFVDPSELLQLKVVSRHGQGSQALVRLRGQVGRERLTVIGCQPCNFPKRLRAKSGADPACAWTCKPLLPRLPPAGLSHIKSQPVICI